VPLSEWDEGEVRARDGAAREQVLGAISAQVKELAQVGGWMKMGIRHFV
jgi:hypothetical protein